MNSENNERTTTNAAGSPAGGQLPPGELYDENEKLKHMMQARNARDAVLLELRSAGAVTPELLTSVIEKDLQFGDNGEPENIAALVDRLKRIYPAQFPAPASTPVAAIDGGAGSGSRNDLSREALAKMTTAEIAALDWDDVRRVLRSR